METVLALDPHHADALNYLGYSYAERGIKMEQALSLTKQAVALKPDNGYYVDSLGWAFYKSGQFNEALIEIKRAVALVGDDPVIYEHLGEIYAKQQKLSEARRPGSIRSSWIPPTTSSFSDFANKDLMILQAKIVFNRRSAAYQRRYSQSNPLSSSFSSA